NPDPRILLIELTEADVRENAKHGFSVSDGVLATLLEKLNRHQPRVIGLHIFRDIPLQPGHEALVKHLKTDENLVTICYFGEEGKHEIPPPASPPGQVGFNNFINDPPNDWIRRYLFYRSPNGDEGLTHCVSQHSFAFQLVFRYLEADGVSFHQDEQKNWLVGDRRLQKLQLRSAAYQSIDNRGNQIMINYRRSQTVARSITLADTLADNYDPDWITDKVVMIGVTAPTMKDNDWKTPVGSLSGLHLHAHAVSQIISAVKDDRPLIWWFSQWVDALLVLGAALIGVGMGGWWRSSPLLLGLGIATSSVILYLLCHALFGQLGLWLPLIPMLLTIPGSALGFRLYPAWKRHLAQQSSTSLPKESTLNVSTH
ncbi:MAG: CHASE2 domain-containing protein, partial [Leptolyngbyaceae cyanobacterium bins.59]|nr:CHASE2 domain-containing protein [Leptolyngbyaceae cyanobacterium bins.59]